MITLQADPLVEWDETDTSLNGQSDEAQAWIIENLFSQSPTIVEETVTRADTSELTRVKSQTYTDGTFSLLVDRTYPSVEDCARPQATYTLTTI